MKDGGVKLFRTKTRYFRCGGQQTDYRLGRGGNQHFYFPAQSPAGRSVAVWQPYKPQLSSAHKPQSENQLGLTDGTFGLSSLA